MKQEIAEKLDYEAILKKLKIRVVWWMNRLYFVEHANIASPIWEWSGNESVEGRFSSPKNVIADSIEEAYKIAFEQIRQHSSGKNLIEFNAAIEQVKAA